MIAAYAGASIGHIQILSVFDGNSSRLRLRMPATIAKKLLAGFEHRDPLLEAFLEDFVLLRVNLPAPVQARAVRASTTDTTERGLETLIMRHMSGGDGLAVVPGAVAEKPDALGNGYVAGCPKDYDCAHALEVPQLFAFLRATQPVAFKKLGIETEGDTTDINRLRSRRHGPRGCAGRDW
jgi:type I restriction enzyme R subunit